MRTKNVVGKTRPKKKLEGGVSSLEISRQGQKQSIHMEIWR